jgi:uncharacterized repeat protein (TIGR03803 family)
MRSLVVCKTRLQKTLLTTSHIFLTSALFSILLVSLAGRSHAQTAHVLYSFTGGADGGSPEASLIRDAAGNFYSTTYSGGADGYGTVFVLSPGGLEKVLYSFTGGTDGANPSSGLILDAQGYLFGTTDLGGAYGKGTVFRINPSGGETVLFSFTGGADGAYPAAGLTLDANGYYMYGITNLGGAGNWGTVFMVGPTGGLTTLYAFTGGTDGAYPAASLIQDAAGNLYGTTYSGGANSNGTVFMLSPSHVETVLYSFAGGNDGAAPQAALIQDAQGNFYGTTPYGNPNDWGTVYRLNPQHAEKVIFSFVAQAQGQRPVAHLVGDGRGELFGTTPYGGAYGVGIVFAVNLKGVEKVLHIFRKKDGAYPDARLFRDAAGNLYGTTSSGGAHGHGVVFEVHP